MASLVNVPFSIGILMVLISFWVIEGVIAGDQLAEPALAGFEEVEGFFDVLAAIVNAVIALPIVLFNFLTLNIPGAPTVVRVFVGTASSVALTYSFAVLVRGGGSA